MIGSFWNLCRACPSMPVDKLHSEYRSTYRWHEYTGSSRPEVIKKPPVTNQFASSVDHFFSKSTEEERHTEGTINEPPLPRRKKCPELAYRTTHEFLAYDTKSKNDSNARTYNGRARSEERVTPSRRSKSEGPYRIPNGDAFPIGDTVDKPNAENKAASTQELEPLCTDEKTEKKTDFVVKRAVRPVSHYAVEIKFKNAHTDKENFGFADDNKNLNRIDNKALVNGGHAAQTWYRDVVELRKKAEEYRNRGWGIEINPDLYKKQKDLWEQVSRRSSLSALSLASAVHKPITKAEKDAANNKKSSPIKAANAKNASQINFIDNKLVNDGTMPGRVLHIRHHLGRTTGLDMEDGALLPSPTRDKLMPTIPKSKEDESYSSQRGSPKKSAISRHGSPQKGSPQKQSAQKKTIKQNRSQSVGPAPSNVDGSPKRQVRSGSAAPASTKGAKKTPVSTPTVVERRPRPNEDDTDKDGVTSLSSASPIPAHEVYEHIIKSPPEPTRVKSPEQILMRSPDPVNWIVPLDTGKTFTVTQNIRNGDPVARPQSEFKVLTPVIDKLPSAPLSAPPNVIEQAKMEAWKNDKLDDILPIKEPPHPTIISTGPYDKPVPGSTLRCLDDPNFNPDVNSPSASINPPAAATDDLNEARDRFDRFWGCNKDKNEKF